MKEILSKIKNKIHELKESYKLAEELDEWEKEGDEGAAITDLEKVDMVRKKRDGGIELFLVTTAYLDDSEEIKELLTKKLSFYLGFIKSEEFRLKYGAVKPLKLTIICTSEPHQQIKDLVANVVSQVPQEELQFAIEVRKE